MINKRCIKLRGKFRATGCKVERDILCDAGKRNDVGEEKEGSKGLRNMEKVLRNRRRED